MSASDAFMVQKLRDMAAQVSKLADDLEAGKLWPGQLSDGLRTAYTSASELKRSVDDSRPRISRGSRW